MPNEPRVDPTESTAGMDAEEWRQAAARSDRQDGVEIRSGLTIVGEVLDQRFDGRCLEQGADRNLDIEARPDPADQTRRQQRMPTQRKEVVVDPYPFEAQHLREQATEHFLLRRTRTAHH